MAEEEKLKNDPIFEETLELLQLHIVEEWGDTTPLSVFCRLLAKHIDGKEIRRTRRMRIDPADIRTTREKRTLSELAKFPKWHDKPFPGRDDVPLIVAVYEGKEYLLDGHTRINYWTNNGNEGPHPVNVHVIET